MNEPKSKLDLLIDKTAAIVEAETAKEKARPVRTLIDSTRIKIDPSLQTRVHEHPELVLEYAASLEAGDTLPDIDLFREGEWWLVGDGVHRLRAYREKGIGMIPSRCFEGGREAALLCAVKANKSHGRKRTREDARKAIRLFLTEPNWYRRSDREVAKACEVDGKTVASVRAELEDAGIIPRLETREGADGKQQASSKNQVRNSAPEPPRAEQPSLFAERPKDHNASADLYPDPYSQPFTKQDLTAHVHEPRRLRIDSATTRNQTSLSSFDGAEAASIQRATEQCDDVSKEERDRQAAGEATQEEILGAQRKLAETQVSVRVERPEKKEGSFQHYNTPPEEILRAKQLGPIGLDPFHNAGSMWGARLTIDEEQDCYSSLYDWTGMAEGDLIPCNPPWQALTPAVDQIVKEAAKGGQLLLIGPSGNTSSGWWQKAANTCTLRCELKERLSYWKDGKPDPNPRDSTTVFYWGNQPGRFAAIYSKHGTISRVVPEEVYAQASESLRAEALEEENAPIESPFKKKAKPKVTPENRCSYGGNGSCKEPAAEPAAYCKAHIKQAQQEFDERNPPARKRAAPKPKRKEEAAKPSAKKKARR